MESNATVTGGDGEMDGQSVRLTEASFNAFAASMQTNIFIAIFILVVFSALRFRFSHVYAPRWTHRVTGNNHFADPPTGFFVAGY